MRRSLCLALVSACYVVPPAAPPPQPPRVVAQLPPAEAPQITKGRYLAQLGGCTTCHTAVTPAGTRDMPRALAGGFEVQFGTSGAWRSPNITPDRETGIGDWTDAELVAAIRDGRGRDGRQLLPIMPSAYYRWLTDEDTAAIVAYLRAQPAIPNMVTPSAGVFMDPAPAVEQPKDRGAYVANLMHCDGCHTPRIGPHANEPFAGGVAFELGDGHGCVSANITNDMTTGIGAWSDDEFVSTIRLMKRPTGEPIYGPMAMYRDAWSHITGEDARALTTYVRSIAPVKNELPERHPIVTSK